jgi:hypothetical protein
MKKLLLLTTVLFVGCTTPHKIEEPNLPKGLSDCEVYATVYGTVIRCPETTTTSYMNGKIPVNNAVTNTKLPVPKVSVDSGTGKIVIQYEAKP